MTVMVNINGAVVPPEQAMVSVFDRGFLFGDGIYETLRTYGKTLFQLDEHLERLSISASRLFLTIPGGIEGIRTELARTLLACDHSNSYIRIIISRGGTPGRVNLDLKSADHNETLVIIAREFEGYPASCHEKGVDLAVVELRRVARDALDPAIKSGNYLNNLLALNQAKEQGAFECIMLNAGGYLTEGATSNLFMIKDGVLLTPSLESGILAGVTRAIVLALAREEGIPVKEALLRAEDLKQADEAFLTSSLKEIMPVRAVDGEAYAGAIAGPVTLRLKQAYSRLVEAECGPQAH